MEKTTPEIPSITLENYCDQVLRTERAPTESVMLTAEQTQALYAVLVAQIRLSEAQDAFKRMLFYNKETDPRTIVDKVQSVVPAIPSFEPLTIDVQTFRVLHSVIGIASEAGELADLIGAHIFGGNPLDPVHFGEELGDVSWYAATGCNAIGTAFGQMLQGNIGKLVLKRYAKEGYSDSQALNRDLVSEREYLESVLTPGEPRFLKVQ